MFDNTDTKLSGFITQASPEDLTVIATQVFGRVGTLNPEQRKLFIKNLQRDAEVKQVLEQLQQDQIW